MENAKPLQRGWRVVLSLGVVAWFPPLLRASALSASVTVTGYLIVVALLSMVATGRLHPAAPTWLRRFASVCCHHWVLTSVWLAMSVLALTFGRGVRIEHVADAALRDRLASESGARIRAAQAADRSLRSSRVIAVRNARELIAKGRSAEASGDFGTAARLCSSIQDNLFRLDMLEPPSPEVRASILEIEQCVADVGPFAEAMTALEAKYPDALVEDDAYVKALRSLEGRESTVHPKLADSLRRQLKQRESKIHDVVKTYRADREWERQDRAKQLAMRSICGATPPVTGLWGEVIGAAAYLGQDEDDPSSVKVEKCSEPRLTRDRCWVLTCNVRHRNVFGALVLNRHEFSVGSDNTILGYR